MCTITIITMQCEQKHHHRSLDFFFHHLIILVLSASKVGTQSSPQTEVFEFELYNTYKMFL